MIFPKKIPKNERISTSRQKKQERGIWQRRFWEYCIRDERDFYFHIDYIHINPLKHGLVNRVIDWQYSSFHRYVENGILPKNWGG
ncbi:REP-associated tyrosine transposase [Moraxella oblonga]|uniref:REP-associated tyrosine transposase n=1 Tax=Moraxella oblonga TaxID=200413 RepID=UPI003F6F9188